MKKLIITIILLLTFCNSADEHPNLLLSSQKVLNRDKMIPAQKLSFVIAYERLRYFEGNYAYQKYDKGGETYGGVARKYNKGWYGWKYIDKNRKTLKQNKLIPEAELWVLDFYLDIWVKEEFYNIQNQDVANYVFDFRINSYHSAIKRVQETLNLMGQKIEVTKKMDSSTIRAINNVPPHLFISKLKHSRISLYKKIISRDSNQKIFYKNWVNRANTIKMPT